MSIRSRRKTSSEVAINPNLRQLGIGTITEDAYVRFGSYTNNHRHFPRLNDGLKTSYRRLLFSSLTFPAEKKVSTGTVISKMADWHPHGLTGVEGVVRAYVHSGIFDGDGNFGDVYIDGSEASPAAVRYTKVKLSDTYREIIPNELLKEVPWEETPVSGTEPSYIPLPLPLCLYMAETVIGLGVGVRSYIPNFSAKSLFNAYINDDPTLLEPNIRIHLDKSKSELHSLWTRGYGKITYSYDVQPYDDGKMQGVMFTGDTGIFTVDMRKLNKLVEAGKIVVDNMTVQGEYRMLVSKVPGARGIDQADIEALCRSVAVNTTNYILNVSDGVTSFTIPLREWIHHTYTNYITLLKSLNQKRIDKTRFDIEVQAALPQIVDYVVKVNPSAEDEEISSKLDIPMQVVKEVMTKPISHLRKNRDTTARITALNKQLKDLINFSPEKHTFDIIQKL